MSRSVFGDSYPAGCSGPPERDWEYEFRASGNARQRRRARRAHFGRCGKHQRTRSAQGLCDECCREESAAEMYADDAMVIDDALEDYMSDTIVATGWNTPEGQEYMDSLRCEC